MISSKLLRRLVSSILLLPLCALALDPVPELKLRTSFSPKAAEFQGKPGVWFPNDDAEYLLKLRIELVPNLYTVAKTQEAILDEYSKRSALIDTTLKLEQERSLRLESAERSCQVSLQKCLGERPWYNTTTAHIIYGFITGVLFTGGIVWVARK